MELTAAQTLILTAIVENRKSLTSKVKAKPGLVWNMDREVPIAMASTKKLMELGHSEDNILFLESVELLERWEPTDKEAIALVSRWAPPEPPAVILTARAAQLINVVLCERLESVEVFATLSNGKPNPKRKTKVLEESPFWASPEKAAWIERQIRRMLRMGRSRDHRIDLETIPDPGPGPDFLSDPTTGETTKKIDEVPENSLLFSVMGKTGVFPVVISKRPLRGKS